MEREVTPPQDEKGLWLEIWSSTTDQGSTLPSHSTPLLPAGIPKECPHPCLDPRPGVEMLWGVSLRRKLNLDSYHCCFGVTSSLGEPDGSCQLYTAEWEELMLIFGPFRTTPPACISALEEKPVILPGRDAITKNWRKQFVVLPPHNEPLLQKADPWRSHRV